MPTKQDYDEAREFLERNGERYRQLVLAVRSACEQVKRERSSEVKQFYSRSDKQNSQELKSAEKLPKKLMRLRKKFGPDQTYADIPDIVGVTIVVNYPDQIEAALNDVLSILKDDRIKLKGTIDKMTDLGYYAHHAVVISSAPRHNRLCCEIQCKTSLHDAWATKTHDLTYKPAGVLDRRDQAMMQFFGDTLERFERQSELIRDGIVDRWNEGLRRRRLLGISMFHSSTVIAKQPDVPQAAREIRRELEQRKVELRSCPLNDDAIRALMDRIDAVFTADIFEGWKLAAILSYTRATSDLSHYLAGTSDRWLAKARALIAEGQPVSSTSIFVVPLAFSAAGNFDLAIDYSQRLIKDCGKLGLDEAAKASITHNMAYFYVERECYEPSVDPARSSDARAAAQKLLNAVAQHCSQSLPQTAIDDVRGLALITFSESLKEIREGIEICDRCLRELRKERAALEASADATAEATRRINWMVIGEHYCEANIRMGWRRLLRMEQQDTDSLEKDLACLLQP